MGVRTESAIGRVERAAPAPRSPRAPARRHRPATEHLVFAGLAVLLLVAVLSDHWGRFIPDTKPQLYQAPGRELLNDLSAWQPNPYLGLPNFNTGQAPLDLLIWAIRSLGSPAWLTVRIWRAALLLVAGWGAVRLLRRVAGDDATPVARIAVAVAYVANPYVIVSGAVTPILLPYAVLPWLLTAFAGSVAEPRSWRWPARFALAFFLMSGMQAGVVSLLMLLGLPAYLVYARLTDGVPFREMARATGRCLGLSLVVSLYWLLPAIGASGAGSEIVRGTERPDDVARTTSFAESLRLLGLWTLYGRNGTAPYLPNLVGYLTNPLVVAASALLPAAAAASAWLSRARARLFAGVLLAFAVPLMVGLFPPGGQSPLGRLIGEAFQEVPGAIAFRNLNKVGPLVALRWPCCSPSALPPLPSGWREGRAGSVRSRSAGAPSSPPPPPSRC